MQSEEASQDHVTSQEAISTDTQEAAPTAPDADADEEPTQVPETAAAEPTEEESTEAQAEPEQIAAESLPEASVEEPNVAVSEEAVVDETTDAKVNFAYTFCFQ